MKRAEFNGVYIKSLLCFVEVWASEEICSDAEVDFSTVFQDVSSDAFHLRHLDYSAGDDDEVERKVLELIEERVIEGFQIWKYLKLPEWTKSMLERSFAVEQESVFEKAKKKYPCLTCGKFKMDRCPLGTRDVCMDEAKVKSLKEKHRAERWVFSFEEIKSCESWAPRDEI